MDFRPITNDHQPIIHTTSQMGYKVYSKSFIYGPSQKGEGRSSPEHMGNGRAVNGERTRRKRRGGEGNTCN